MNTTNSDDSKGCSLVIPVYNEQGILQDHTQRLVDFMNSLSQPYELLIVSNGSKDGTVSLGLMMERRFPAVRFFHLPKKGVGNAFQAAINQNLLVKDDVPGIDKLQAIISSYCPDI